MRNQYFGVCLEREIIIKLLNGGNIQKRNDKCICLQTVSGRASQNLPTLPLFGVSRKSYIVRLCIQTMCVVQDTKKVAPNYLFRGTVELYLLPGYISISLPNTKSVQGLALTLTYPQEARVKRDVLCFVASNHIIMYHLPLRYWFGYPLETSHFV